MSAGHRPAASFPDNQQLDTRSRVGCDLDRNQFNAIMAVPESHEWMLFDLILCGAHLFQAVQCLGLDFHVLLE
ncbi:hypothetical protein OAL86_04430 [Verrucomicrobia bacterium]|nr:hypothetical protein [Verrucomicrobiota bacterium]